MMNHVLSHNWLYDTILSRTQVKNNTFPNLSGANMQYIEEYYNFSKSYFYLFSNISVPLKSEH